MEENRRGKGKFDIDIWLSVIALNVCALQAFGVMANASNSGNDNDDQFSSDDLELDSCSSLCHPILPDKRSSNEDGCKILSPWGLPMFPN